MAYQHLVSDSDGQRTGSKAATGGEGAIPEARGNGKAARRPPPISKVGAIAPWLPLFLFSVLFGLSMDYNVFLLSRIRERFSETADNTDSIAFGVGTTARLITGAALIIVAVYIGFAVGDLVMFQQMGFGVAVALLIDATIIRSVLVPAAMKLLGERNWYFPSWLRWLPRMQMEQARTARTGGDETASTHTPVPALPSSLVIEPRSAQAAASPLHAMRSMPEGRR